MRDYPTIEAGSYTWHPIMPSLTTLIRDMYGALKELPPEEHPGITARRARKKDELEARINENAEAIIEMKTEGLSNVEVGKRLGVSAGTVCTWWNRIKKERGL